MLNTVNVVYLFLIDSSVEYKAASYLLCIASQKGGYETDYTIALFETAWIFASRNSYFIFNLKKFYFTNSSNKLFLEMFKKLPI